MPAIVQDRQGFIWLATRDGLARYDGHQFKVFRPVPNKRSSLSSAEISRIWLDQQGKIWIMGETGSLDRFDPLTEQVMVINLKAQSIYRAIRSNVGQFMLFSVDQQNRLWLGHNGLLRFNWRTKQVRHYQHQPGQPTSLRNDLVMAVQQTPDGKTWVLTQTGLDCLDEKTNSFRHYLTFSGSENPPKGFWIRSSGEVLISTDRLLYVFQPVSGQVRSFPLPPPPHPVSFAHFAEDRAGRVYFARHTEIFSFTDQQGVRLLDSGTGQTLDAYLSAFVDRSDVLWLGTAGAGVRKYDLRALPFQTSRYRHDFVTDLLTQGWLGPAVHAAPPTLQGLTSYNFRYTIDRQGGIWYNMGSSDIYRLDPTTGRSEQIPFPVQFRNVYIGLMPCPMTTDPQGRVWAVYDSTAYWFDPQTRGWRTFPFRIPMASDNNVQMLTIDGRALWLATATGGLWRLDRATGRLTRFTSDPRRATSLSSNSLLCLATDPTDSTTLWIGTLGSGLCQFNKRTGHVQQLSTANGLPNNVIYSAMPDQRGHLWIGTNKGISRIDRRTLAVRTYTTQDGLLADEFNRFHFLRLPARAAHPERILMGGLEGITAFYPDQIRPDTFQPRVEPTALYVNNKPVVPGPGSPLGSLPIQATSALTLSYRQNFVGLDFSALQYNRTGKNQYRYQLVGLDTGWVESRRPEAVFTGLQPGHYTLRLNASNVSGSWSPHVRTLSLVITPPWWATWWAYVLYVLVGLSVIYWLFRNYANRLQMRQSIGQKERETRQLRDLNELKTRFFANITHEFRTPLTLILGPLEQLTGESLDPRIRRRLSTIEQNAQQLLRLTNQLLELSRLEGGALAVHPSRGELSACVAHWLEPLTEQAIHQGIQLTFESDLTGSYWFDVAQFERIVVNLTANALKFTPAGGVTVSLTDAPDGIMLTVADTGVGIPVAQLPRIFERFFQIPGQSVNGRDGGTGIGLALVNELVHLHKGNIAVESTVGQGTRFFVTLPYPKASAQPRPEAGARPPVPESIDAQPVDLAEVRVLLVEDNDELAQFITESLPATYQLQRAVDGQAGLEQALAELPDLVISDVMMPRMDGFALCNALKTDQRTSHIPVILLTAKTTTDDRLTGLTLGADDYLTKPFHVAELQLRVQNLLTQQQRQRAWLARQLTTADGAEAPVPASPEDPFLIQLYAVLDAQLANPSLNVDLLAGELAMSRTTLHRKLKALSGFSTNELIRNYRLKAAAGLLRQGHTSAETAGRVGFENLSYFAKAFREAYGVSPAEFVRTSPKSSTK